MMTEMQTLKSSYEVSEATKVDTGKWATGYGNWFLHAVRFTVRKS